MDFDLIYQAYFKDAFLYMCSLSADENIAEEITQEAFTKALKSLDSFDGKKDIRAWLFMLTELLATILAIWWQSIWSIAKNAKKNMKP